MVVSGYVPQAQTILYNFGSPRIFNYPVQQAVQAAIPVYFRVTHYKDIFVHLPPCQSSLFGTCETGKYGPASDNEGNIITNTLDATYNIVRDEVLTAALGGEDQESLGWNPFWAPWHIQNQIFYNTEDSSTWVSCVGAEDPLCSNRFNTLACNIGDHLVYINVVMGQCNLAKKAF